MLSTLFTYKEKDQEINYFRKNVQVVLVGKDRSDFLGELSKSKRKSKKQKSQMMSIK